MRVIRTGEAHQVRAEGESARVGVMAFGVIAYVMAQGAEGVFELVEEASAFGSAGTLVTVCFGLFTSWGGARAAIATPLMGVVSYLTANALGTVAPFLISLTASLATYSLVAAFEHPQPTAQST